MLGQQGTPGLRSNTQGVRGIVEDGSTRLGHLNSFSTARTGHDVMRGRRDFAVKITYRSYLGISIPFSDNFLLVVEHEDGSII